ncbi:succinate-semialdehyde dehydrogenase / glutarate-semialdehyde dehydrogenase [Jatrophihabitans endophyticus]|uniref:succinate-semialdehyde dehydrogenase (NADP(+)) n=1 Tax=Jatrophihabitans endophyticus TaxID=1206085 RepID=A0A1M5H8D4_9ACTN|nr:succinic semialdehyde dehydrogenase [Jatrophihabitans endophyticus]SHG11972.1 succinate-semialdehyde dehydrogenase / glutarate-semialdehyde dehydrogenase [Jatrophihabitans endophyticus]
MTATVRERPERGPAPRRRAATDRALPADRVAALVARAAAGGAEPVTTHAPATGALVADLPQSSPADIDAAFERARAAQQQWARRPLAERVRVLARLHDLVLARQREILDILQTETGKARAHAFEEVADVAINARYYARTAKHHLRSHDRMGVLPGLTTAHEARRPVGVVVVISPWNYPLALSVSDALPALVAGNAVVSRPDNQTALTTLWAHELAEEAGLPADLWQVVLGRGRDVGAPLIERADFVDYTGSTATGRDIAAQASARLIGCSLELGGKNPMLVLADADPRKAADGAVRACYSSAGQLCESMERLYVHTDVYDEFVEAFLERVERIRLGAELSYDSDMGSLTFARQLDTVVTHVEDAVAKGATVLAGGRARPDLGPYFYEPTVLTDVTADMLVHREETFGPVVSLYRVDTDDEAVTQANDTAYGLNASVWTRDVGHGRRVAERIRAGAVNVNEGYTAAWASVQAPSGGLGDSGLGRRHGAEGILKYTNTQTVAVQRLLPIAPLPGMSDAVWARTMTAALWAFRRVGIK